MGHRRLRPLQRHVRLRDPRRDHRHRHPRPRPLRHQAALLPRGPRLRGRRGAEGRLRLGDPLAARLRHLRGRAGRPRRLPLPEVPRPGRRLPHLLRRREPPDVRRGARDPPRRHRGALLHPAEGGAARDRRPPQPSLRPVGRGRVPRALPGLRADAPAVRGPRRHLPLRRAGLLRRRRRDRAPAARAARGRGLRGGRLPPEHLLRRLPELLQRRGALRRRAAGREPRPDHGPQDPPAARGVPRGPPRLRAHPGGADHLDRPLRAVRRDARGQPAHHRAPGRAGRRRDDGRVQPVLLRLPAPAAPPEAVQGARLRGRRLPRHPPQARPHQVLRPHLRADGGAAELRLRRRAQRREGHLRPGRPQGAPARGHLPLLPALAARTRTRCASASRGASPSSTRSC